MSDENNARGLGPIPPGIVSVTNGSSDASMKKYATVDALTEFELKERLRAKNINSSLERLNTENFDQAKQIKLLQVWTWFFGITSVLGAGIATALWVLVWPVVFG